MDGSSSLDTRTARITAEEALALHAEGRPGKLEIRLSKPLTTARPGPPHHGLISKPGMSSA